VDCYRALFRPVLFRIDAEWAHRSALAVCRAPLLRGLLPRRFAHDDPRLRTRVAGIDFPNPIGLAAGFDKNGVALDGLAELGFGAIEVGSVSLHASTGNMVRPRLFRLPRDEALLVHYGVPNDGAEAVAARIAASRLDAPVAVSLVETNTGREVSADRVIVELTQAARVFAPRADCLVLNLHCPNSVGGAGPFGESANLGELLEALRGIGRLPPVFLKFAAPRAPKAIDAILEVVDPYEFVRGFIPNVVPLRPWAGLVTPPEAYARLPGSLTGAPLRPLARELVGAWYARIDRKRHVLIGVGGISSGEDAYRLIRAGASFVQLLTALVYQGPMLVARIQEELCRLLDRDGLRSVSQAVGADLEEWT
jgi:dihydroorotate dehydrogenase